MLRKLAEPFSFSQKNTLLQFWTRRHRLQSLLARLAPGRLNFLACIYATDKASFSHGYTKTYYPRHLPDRRGVQCLLEIGIGGTTSAGGYEGPLGGQSLRMWQTYFPAARIVGLDIHPKSVTGERITTMVGSQDDQDCLARLVEDHGPFDVVIDDGSHVGRHVEASFRSLFRHVRPGGVYVIEDLRTSYLPGWEGGPPGKPGTQANLLARLVDDVLRPYWDESGVAFPVRAIHVYDEIAFIERS